MDNLMQTIFEIYGAISLIFFTFVFFVRITDENLTAPTGRPYGVTDHFWLSLALGITWPYAIVILFFQGADRGPRNPDI